MSPALALSRFIVAWVVLDLRALSFALLAAALLAVAGIALFTRTARWHERLTLFVALTMIFAVLIVGVCNVFLAAPVFMVRSTFPLP